MRCPFPATYFCLILSVSAFPQDSGIIQCDPGKNQVIAWTEPGSAWAAETLACGQTVHIIGLGNGYYKIRIGSKLAYVYEKYVKYPRSQEQPIPQAKPQIEGPQQPPQPQTDDLTLDSASASIPQEESETTQVTVTFDSEARGSASAKWTLLPPSEAELQGRRRNEIERAATEKAATKESATKRAVEAREERVAEHRWIPKEESIHRGLPPATSAEAMHLQAELEDITRKLEWESEARRQPPPIEKANFVGIPSCTVSNLGGVMITVKSTGAVATSSRLLGVTLKGSANITCTSESNATQTTSSIPFLGLGSINGDLLGRNSNLSFSVSDSIRCPGPAKATFFVTPFEATLTVYRGLPPRENVLDSVTVTCK